MNAAKRSSLCRSASSASLRSSISVLVPYHLTIFPCSSRSGTVRTRNQRYCLNLPGILERYLLRLLAIGDVLGNASDPTNLVGRISHGKSAVADPSQRPVRSHDAVFHIKSLFAPPFKDTDHALAILAMYRVRE